VAKRGRPSRTTKLSRAIARTKYPGPNYAKQLLEFIKPDEPTGGEVDWPRAIEADAVLRLYRHDVPLQKAFDAFGLDPNRPVDWGHLIRALANLHYGCDDKGGAPRKWDLKRQLELKAEAEAIKTIAAEKGRSLTLRDVAKLIKKTRPTEYKAVQIDTIERYLRRNPRSRAMAD
jgi:hypothetical protein